MKWRNSEFQEETKREKDEEEKEEEGEKEEDVEEEEESLSGGFALRMKLGMRTSLSVG